MTSSSTAGVPPGNAQAPARARSLPWMWLALLLVVAIALAAGGYWYFAGRFIETTDDAYVGGDVTVMAPRVSGFVTDVAVTDNQYVHANDVLIRLDARDYDARLADANAQLQRAHADASELAAQRALQLAVIDEQAAGVQAANAELTRSAADQTRYRELVKDEAVSSQLTERADADLSKARAALARSNATLLAAQRRLAVLDAQVEAVKAHVLSATAAQRVAELNVEYTTLRAPLDGYVGNRTARTGMLANIGAALLTVVPARGLWVDANFKEDQLRRMRPGDKVDVQLDASSQPLAGVVESLAPATGATFSILPAENATGNFTKIVQRVPVRIRLDVPNDMQQVLRPGLSATVRVHLDTAGGGSGGGSSAGLPQAAGAARDSAASATAPATGDAR
ncbi:HlyD family secretion protein [Paraburkholderia jirisanensis]